jgi:hypothetical protein
MRQLLSLPLGAALLAGCSGKDRIADKVEDQAENRAEVMDEAAEAMTNALQANAAEQQAETVRQAGKERAEAIRDSQLDAGDLSNAQKNALVKGDSAGTPARETR